MRKRKKGPVLLLAVLLILSGCGNAEAPGTGEEPAAGNSIETSQEASVAESAEEAEQEDESEESSRSMESEEAEESSSESGEEESREPEEEASASGTKEAESSKPAPTPTPEPTEAPEEPTPAETPAPEASAQTPESTPTQPQAPAATPTPAPQQTHSCTWDGGTVTQAATCTAEGVKTYTCTSCGNTRTESIPKTDHSYAWYYSLEEDLGLGNCLTRYRLVDICANCGYILNTYKDLTYENHEMGEVVWGEGNSCTSTVTGTQTCIKCGGVVTQSVGPSGHRLDDAGNCKVCGEHTEHQWLWDEIDQKYYCYCGAEKD